MQKLVLLKSKELFNVFGIEIKKICVCLPLCSIGFVAVVSCQSLLEIGKKKFRAWVPLFGATEAIKNLKKRKISNVSLILAWR